MTMDIYTVRFEVEIHAASPEQAAIIARDIMLDPDAQVHDSGLSVDVFPHEYVKDADDWFPTHEHGWYAWFDGGVRPKDFFPWEKMKT